MVWCFEKIGDKFKVSQVELGIKSVVIWKYQQKPGEKIYENFYLDLKSRENNQTPCLIKNNPVQYGNWKENSW